MKGYLALAAGTPLVSLLSPQTVFGGALWYRTDGADSGGDPVEVRISTCARTTDDYVALAQRLADDAAFREQAAAAGRAFYLAEQARADEYSRRFFDAARAIAGAKVGRPVESR